MKVYIAGPMSGLPEYNYPAFESAAQHLKDLGYEVYCPTQAEDEHDGERFSQPYEWYLRKALQMLLACDLIALLPHWTESKGARLEAQVARTLSMPIIYLD